MHHVDRGAGHPGGGLLRPVGGLGGSQGANPGGSVFSVGRPMDNPQPCSAHRDRDAVPLCHLVAIANTWDSVGDGAPEVLSAGSPSNRIR